jgi:hypothetical protein
MRKLKLDTFIVALSGGLVAASALLALGFRRGSTAPAVNEMPTASSNTEGSSAAARSSGWA